MKALIPLLALVVVACPAQEHEDIFAHACEHVGEGASIAASASEDAAPLLVGDALVTLSADASTYVSFETETADEAITVFADATAVVDGLRFGGADETLPAGAANEDCPESIPEHFDLDLEAQGTWTLVLAPSALDSVWLSVVESGEHGHDE